MKITSWATVAAAAGLTLLLGACSLLGTSQPTRTPSASVTSSQSLSAFQLHIGDCIMEPDGDTFSNVSAVPCTQAHDAEVADLFNMPAGSFDPAAIQTAANKCENSVRAYVGQNYLGAGLDWNYFAPTQGSWANGDREIDCLVYNLSGDQLTKSVKGAGV